MSDQEKSGSEYGWHLDKRFNVGHIITTAMLAFALFQWAGETDKRIAVLEERSVAQKEVEVRRDNAFRESIGDLKTAILLLNEKLDKLIDKRGQ